MTPIQFCLLLLFWVLPAAGQTSSTDPGCRISMPSRTGGYLVISAPRFTGGAGLHDLINLRSSQGFDVTLVDTNTTGQNAYNTWIIPPSILLLVGDVDPIPCWTGSGSGGPPTDLYYASMDSHFLPEIMCELTVNRLSGRPRNSRGCADR